jgi:hypothetical protein
MSHSRPRQALGYWKRCPGFSTADAYRILHNSTCDPPLHDQNRDNFPPVKVFIWILWHRRTRMRTRLCRLGVVSSSDFPSCVGMPEDVQHLFVASPASSPFGGHASPASFLVAPSSLEDMIGAFFDARQNWPPILRNMAAALLLWIIWKTWIRLIFDAMRVTTWIPNSSQ